MFTVSAPCFFEFLGLLNEFFLRSLVLGVGVGFGGREGALASALIRVFLSHVARLIIVPYRDDSAAHFVRGRAHSVGQGFFYS